MEWGVGIVADGFVTGYEPDLLEDEVGEGRVLEFYVRIGLMVDEDGGCTDSEMGRAVSDLCRF